MMLRSLLKASSLCLATSAIAFGLAGCSANPENAPAIKKKFSEVDDMKENLDDNNQLLRTIASDLAILKDQMSNMRAMDPNSEAGSELLSRLDGLERQFGSIEAGSESMISEIAATATARNTPTQTTPVNNTPNLAIPPSAQRSTATSSSTGRGMERLVPLDQRSLRATPPSATSTTSTSPANSTASASTSSSSSSSASASSNSSRSSASPAPAPAASRGRYYTLKSGESLESVAQSNGISVEKLREENRIPNGARVLRGQRIYIPGS